MSEVDPTNDMWAEFLDPSKPDPVLEHEEAEMLSRARSTLQQPELWDGPSAGARDRLLSQARQEKPDVVSLASARSRRSRPMMAAAGLVAAAAAIIAVFVLPAGQTPVPTGTTYEVAGGSYLPDAIADVTVDPLANGVKLVITLDDIPAAEAGTYYAGWLMGPDGTVPVGSFHARGTGDVRRVSLWSGTETEDYPMFMVTLQNEGEPLTPSDRIVLQGSVAG